MMSKAFETASPKDDSKETLAAKVHFETLRLILERFVRCLDTLYRLRHCAFLER